MIPDPQNTIGRLFQDQGPTRVVRRGVSVLAAVEFDDQLGFEAGKVREVAVDRRLAAELEAVEGAASEASPQDGFGPGLFLTETAGALNAAFACDVQTLTFPTLRVGPLPLPTGRGNR